MQGSIILISIPPKVWIPKQINQYVPVDDLSDIEEGVFDYKQYGKTIFRPALRWQDRKRDDIIEYDASIDAVEMDKHIKIGKCVSHEHKSIIHGIVKKYWDCFCNRGARRPIISYEFSINTDTAKPVCCRNTVWAI